MDIGGLGSRVAHAAVFAVVCVFAPLAMHCSPGAPRYLLLVGAATVETGVAR